MREADKPKPSQWAGATLIWLGSVAAANLFYDLVFRKSSFDEIVKHEAFTVLPLGLVVFMHYLWEKRRR